MNRYVLTDLDWCVIEPLLPNKSGMENRRVLNDVICVLCFGAGPTASLNRGSARSVPHSSAYS